MKMKAEEKWGFENDFFQGRFKVWPIVNVEPPKNVDLLFYHLGHEKLVHWEGIELIWKLKMC